MKKLDKSILKHLLGVLVITIAIGLIFFTQTTLYMFGWVMALGAFAFIGMHIAFLYPSFMLVFTWIGAFHNMVFKPLAEKSLIIAYLVMWILVAACYFVTLLIYTYIMYMCLEYNTSFEGYILLMGHIANQ